jgi:hypothetical protein
VVGVIKMAALRGCNVAVLSYRVAELVKLIWRKAGMIRREAGMCDNSLARLRQLTWQSCRRRARHFLIGLSCQRAQQGYSAACLGCHWVRLGVTGYRAAKLNYWIAGLSCSWAKLGWRAAWLGCWLAKLSSLAAALGYQWAKLGSTAAGHGLLAFGRREDWGGMTGTILSSYWAGPTPISSVTGVRAVASDLLCPWAAWKREKAQWLV